MALKASEVSVLLLQGLATTDQRSCCYSIVVITERSCGSHVFGLLKPLYTIYSSGSGGSRSALFVSGPCGVELGVEKVVLACCGHKPHRT